MLLSLDCALKRSSVRANIQALCIAVLRLIESSCRVELFVPILYRRPGKVAFLALLAERKINNLRGINTPLEFDSVPGRHLYSFIFSNFQAICANRNNGRTVDAGFGRYFLTQKRTPQFSQFIPATILYVTIPTFIIGGAAAPIGFKDCWTTSLFALVPECAYGKTPS